MAANSQLVRSYFPALASGDASPRWSRLLLEVGPPHRRVPGCLRADSLRGKSAKGMPTRP
eukprot:2056201-Pyramimonas_sp.AAC.1